MKYRFLYIFLLIATSCFAVKPENMTGGFVELGASAGYSTWLMSHTGQEPGTWHAGMQVKTGYWFAPYVGLAVGAEVGRYGTSFKYADQQDFLGVVDTDGEAYDHHLAINRWAETEQHWNLQIPLSLQFQIPTQSVIFHLEAGAKYNILMSSGYKGTGELTHTGYYDRWHLTLQDVDDHGFYTEKNYHPQGTLKLQNYVSVFGAIGLTVPLTDKMDFYSRLSAEYAVLPIFSQQTNTGIQGFRNDRAGMSEAHSFMPGYETLLNTDKVNGKAFPLSTRLEVGVRWRFPVKKKQKHPCTCYMWN